MKRIIKAILILLITIGLTAHWSCSKDECTRRPFSKSINIKYLSYSIDSLHPEYLITISKRTKESIHGEISKYFIKQDTVCRKYIDENNTVTKKHCKGDFGYVSFPYIVLGFSFKDWEVNHNLIIQISLQDSILRMDTLTDIKFYPVGKYGCLYEDPKEVTFKLNGKEIRLDNIDGYKGFSLEVK